MARILSELKVQLSPEGTSWTLLEPLEYHVGSPGVKQQKCLAHVLRSMRSSRYPPIRARTSPACPGAERTRHVVRLHLEADGQKNGR